MKIQMGYVNCPCYSGWGQVWQARDCAHVQMHAQSQVLAVLLLPTWIITVHGLLPVSSLMLHHRLLTMEAISVLSQLPKLSVRGTEKAGEQTQKMDDLPRHRTSSNLFMSLPLMIPPSLPELMQFPCAPRWPNAAWKQRKEGGRERDEAEGHLGKGQRYTSEQRSQRKGGEREVKERAGGWEREGPPNERPSQSEIWGRRREG